MINRDMFNFYKVDTYSECREKTTWIRRKGGLNSPFLAGPDLIDQQSFGIPPTLPLPPIGYGYSHTPCETTSALPLTKVWQLWFSVVRFLPVMQLNNITSAPSRSVNSFKQAILFFTRHSLCTLLWIALLATNVNQRYPNCPRTYKPCRHITSRNPKEEGFVSIDLANVL